MSSTVNAFLDDLRQWARTKNDALLVRALRSPCSGVAPDAAAAYATVALRDGLLLDAIERSHLPLPSSERDALLRFASNVRSITDETDIAALFDIDVALCHPEVQLRSNCLEGPFQLLDPITPDEPAPVRFRKSHFSASALNTHAECERKWYYRYLCGAVEDPGSSAATYGTAFHAALEDFHGEFPRPSPDLEQPMRKRIVGDINWAFERFRNNFDSPVEVELHKRRAQRTAQRYVDWLVSESKRAPFSVVGREMATELDLEGFKFIGYIDRVDRDDRTGAISIIDYKTGSIATSAAEYREKVHSFREFQLPFYYWAQTAAGETVSRLSLIPLKDALLDVRPISLDVGATISQMDLERSRARMIEICDTLTSGRQKQFPVTDDPSACTYCAYKRACAEKPHDERGKFGR